MTFFTKIKLIRNLCVLDSIRYMNILELMMELDI